MIHKENSRLYRADKGKMLVRKSDGKIIGPGIYIGSRDSIDKYEEREFSPDEIKKFWERIKAHIPPNRPERVNRTKPERVTKKTEHKSDD